MTLRISIAQKLAAAFAWSLALLIAIGAVAYLKTDELLDTAAAVTRSYAIREAAATLLADVVNAETGERGYLLTGAGAYLEPYDFALAQIGKDFEKLSKLDVERDLRAAAALAPNGPAASTIEVLRKRVTTRLTQLAETIEARRLKGLDAAIDLILTNRGKEANDEIRVAVADIEQAETRLLQAREAAAHNAAQLTFGTILYGTLLSIVLSAVVGYRVTRSITHPLRAAVAALSSSAAEMLAGTSQQAAGAEEQAAAVAQTAAAVGEIVAAVQHAAERVKSVAEAANKAVVTGDAGRRAVTETIGVMGAVKEQSESIAHSILGLAEHAEAIGEIIAAVNDIAEQTNLLALNAAIEASRAGERGRGFSVVAAEIKLLADQSKRATAQVRQILGDIQKATNGAVVATERGTKSVEEAIRTANLAGTTISTLADTIADSADAAVLVTASAGQHAAGMSQIQQGIESISQAATQNLAATRGTERAAHALDELGVRLKSLLVGTA
ncbi:MAG: CHASE3 domain-containing protein [Alphaproteobacteria bacterium]|nr:CHASE3 domain-containing protein [Alphaproteobacteria bacterium]